ncbi:MAG: hypothetical protein CMN84_10090 [Spongiibacteraceae bacterium]|jgi:hypothetical protein|nr:hypothetical protein [Spongiibacteraceae bacterium]
MDASLTTSLLLLSLTGGYSFSIVWKASLFRSVREQGHRLYFRAAFYTAVCFVCALFLNFNFSLYSKDFAGSQDGFWVAISSFASSEIGSGKLPILLVESFVIGVFLPHILNLIVNILDEVCKKIARVPKASLFLIKPAIQHNDFECLICNAFELEVPILLTLKSRKIYVGWVMDGPNPSVERRYMKILPLISGVRGESFQRLNFTTFYSDVYNQLIEDGKGEEGFQEFEVVIPLDQVANAHLFDLNTYQRFSE